MFIFVHREPTIVEIESDKRKESIEFIDFKGVNHLFAVEHNV